MDVWNALKRRCPESLRATLRSLHARTRRSCSQIGQDFWVFGEVFDGRRGGFFLDVGAADGIALSNTFLLEKRYGWRGICIEPDPQAFARLRRVRSAVCLNVCVDAERGTIEFVERDQLSGIVAADTDNSAAAAEKSVRLDAMPLATILRAQGAPHTIDYLSIDVEGAEDRVLRDFPFDEYRFSCMTVERPKPPLRETLAEHGYELVREMRGLDAFYVHDSFRAEYARNAFSFWQRFRAAHR